MAHYLDLNRVYCINVKLPCINCIGILFGFDRSASSCWWKSDTGWLYRVASLQVCLSGCVLKWVCLKVGVSKWINYKCCFLHKWLAMLHHLTLLWHRKPTSPPHMQLFIFTFIQIMWHVMVLCHLYHGYY